MITSPGMAPSSSVRDHFERALEVLVAKLQNDRNVRAAVLMGSLSYAPVWEKSDIDLLLVTRDEKNERSAVALVELDVNIHASLVTRSEFRGLVEGSLGSSVLHSTLSKGRLLFARDDTLAKLWENLAGLGSRDRQIPLLGAGTRVTYSLYKARKHCEALDQALRLDPLFFGRIYPELMDAPKTAPLLRAALDEIDVWLGGKIPLLFQPILDYLAEAGDVRSVSEIEGSA